MTDTLEMAKKIADVCYEKLAKDTIVLDLSAVSNVCDYYVIANAPTRNQLSDISNHIQDTLEKDGITPKAIQGKHENSWILLDYGIIVVHLFLDQERQFYNLEGLWHNAPMVYAPDQEKQQ